MPDDRTQQEASRAAGSEHDQIAQACFTLDRALAAPAPGREAEWKHRAAAGLAVVTDLLAQHVESSEGEGGLIAQLEVAQGHNRDVTLALADHKRMLEEARTLLDDLTRDRGSTLAVADARGRATALTDLLRRHRWREADLILDVFRIDLGHGD